MRLKQFVEVLNTIPQKCLTIKSIQDVLIIIA